MMTAVVESDYVDLIMWNSEAGYTKPTLLEYSGGRSAV